MKKIMLGAALMALSLPAFSATSLPVSVSSLKVIDLNQLRLGTLVKGFNAVGEINGFPNSAFEVLHLVTAVEPISNTPLNGLVLNSLHSPGHDGNL